MKKTKLKILTGLLLLMISCKNSSTEVSKNYIESKPTFFELHNGEWLKNNWIRKPQNLLLIHETFKKVGYINIIYPFLIANPIVIQDIYINKKGINLIDSLILGYEKRNAVSKYYKEFWARREKEKNDSTVLKILNDIKYSYRTKMTSSTLQLQADDSKLNDTLRQLLEIEFRYDTITTKIGLQDFETLKQLGFHQSAYNILFEINKYQDLKWNKDSLVNTLKQTENYSEAWFQDNTK